LLVLLGCGEQTSTDYRGEALLTFSGRVELLDSSAGKDLVPALAFPGSGGYWQIVDVDVEGEFPAGFTLHVFDPPPEDLIEDGPSFTPGTPAFTTALITAVPRDHARGFQSSSSFITNPDCAEAGPCHTVRRKACYAERESGGPISETADCYEEVRMCDFEIDFALDQDYDSCDVVGTEGDANLARTIASRFSGFSDEFVVMYLGAEAPAGSLVAQMLESRKPVAAGYHLIQRRARTQAEIDQAAQCHDAAAQIAFEQFRREHPATDCQLFGAGFSCRDVEQGRLLSKQIVDAQANQDCPFQGAATLIDVDTDDTELTIRIGHDIGDLGNFVGTQW
jgi:hypothetical protein